MSHSPRRRRPARDSTTHVAGESRWRRVTLAVPGPTLREAVTMLSFPTLLFAVHFVVQPAFDAWPRLGYVRLPAAQSAPAGNVAPPPLTEYVGLWHELTRVSHALVHQPSSTHAHLFGNVALILVAAWALLAALTALDRRRSFALFYWELVVVAPIVGSFAFDLFGQTPHGYGASTVGFAFLGVVASVSVFALVEAVRTRCSRRATATLRADGGTATDPQLLGAVLVFATVVIVADVVSGSSAMPVHQAGVGFGVVLGVVLVPYGDWF